MALASLQRQEPAFLPWPRERVALILDGHGWASRAVVRSLGRAGWRVLAPAGTKCARSRFCTVTVRLPDWGRDAAGFVEATRAVLRGAHVDLVVPGEDATLELLYETVGLLGDARVLGGDRESARLALDKARTLRRAAAAGFAAPNWAEVDSVRDGVAAAREIGFPCVIKPRRSFARIGNMLRSERLCFAAGPEEAGRTLERLMACGFESLLVQERIPGRSIGVAAVVDCGRVLAYGAREAFSQCPVRGGSAVWRATVDAHEPGVQEALELLIKLGFQGMGDVQYHIAQDGTPTLMEIGARTYGWLPLTIAAGADLPLIAARALEGDLPVASPVVARPGLHMRWPRGELARIGEILSTRPQLPPDARRSDVLAQLWPPLAANMLHDGWRTGDRRLRRWL
jgi:predicted ATP-grasp superfamily ATP-dependent carboligase